MQIKVKEYSKSIYNRHLDIILFVIIIKKKRIILFQILFPKKREPVHKETVMLPNKLQDDRHRRNHGNKHRYPWHPAVKNNEKSCTEDYHHCCY